MRSLVLVALLGSGIASTQLLGQSLAEHAAAAAGATIGTAAGKPLGTTLGKIFSDTNQTTSAAATPKTVKTAPAKPSPVTPPQGAAQATAPATVVFAGGGGDEISAGAPSRSSSASSPRRVARRRQPELPPVAAAAPITPVTPVIAEPVVKELTAQDVAGVKVGETANQLRAALGPPESQVSIPDDDGHLVEICQYWAKGEQVGTVRLDNGRVVSVQPIN